VVLEKYISNKIGYCTGKEAEYPFTSLFRKSNEFDLPKYFSSFAP